MMNQTIETILKRRSTRSFMRKPLKEEDLKVIVDCGLHAPSGMGRQTWKFTVVENRERIRELADAVGKELGREGYDMYDPEVLIIPSNLKDSPFGMEDNACAMENIYLAAEALGIGCVWINQLRTICQEPNIRRLLDELHIPQDHVVYGLAALGYRDDTPVLPKERIGQVEYIK
jgi:nitroreductase